LRAAGAGRGTAIADDAAVGDRGILLGHATGAQGSSATLPLSRTGPGATVVGKTGLAGSAASAWDGRRRRGNTSPALARAPRTRRPIGPFLLARALLALLARRALLGRTVLDRGCGQGRTKRGADQSYDGTPAGARGGQRPGQRIEVGSVHGRLSLFGAHRTALRAWQGPAAPASSELCRSLCNSGRASQAAHIAKQRHVPGRSRRRSPS
jgi:hypothetical protein